MFMLQSDVEQGTPYSRFFCEVLLVVSSFWTVIGRDTTINSVHEMHNASGKSLSLHRLLEITSVKSQNADGRKIPANVLMNETELRKVVEMERDAANQEELNVVMTNEESWLRLIGASDESADAEDQIALAESSLNDVINFRIVSGSETTNSVANASSGSGLSSSIASSLVDFVNALEIAKKGKKKSSETAGLTMALLRSSKAMPLSGYSDPVYVEVVMQINHLNLIVEILLVNQTDETLEDVSVALGTHGESKILEKPQGVTLAPRAETTVYATIRLSSTEAGVIFGYCSFQRRSSVDKEYTNLNELQIDLLDCIQRAWMGSLTFRTMWAEFEWENKLALQLPSDDAMSFTLLLLLHTKMTLVGLHEDFATAKKLAEIKAGGSLTLSGGEKVIEIMALSYSQVSQFRFRCS